MRKITVIRYDKPYDMTLNMVWKECLRMWKWVAKNSSKDTVASLKHKWMVRNGYEEILSACFFCEWAGPLSNGPCKDVCPGALVSSCFSCDMLSYCYINKPKAFYRKLLSLNKKRKAACRKKSKQVVI